MFLIIVDYKKPLEEVERYLAEHRAFLDRYFAQGKLLCTGPQNPRTGGVIPVYRLWIFCKGSQRNDW